MLVYKLDVNIDGFGGMLPLKFFKSFDEAVRMLEYTPGFHHLSEDPEDWCIEGTKDTKVSYRENDLYLQGVVFDEKDLIDDDDGDAIWFIRYAHAAITPIELDFNSDTIWTIFVKKGWNSILMEYDPYLDSHYIPESREEFLGFAPTRKKIKKKYQNITSSTLECGTEKMTRTKNASIMIALFTESIR